MQEAPAIVLGFVSVRRFDAGSDSLMASPGSGAR
jgi:hypothetical protein